MKQPDTTNHANEAKSTTTRSERSSSSVVGASTDRTTSDRIKELERRLSLADNARYKVDLYNLLANELSRRSGKNLPRAIAVCETACELCMQVDQFSGKPYLKGLSQSLQNLADFYVQFSHFEMSVSFLARAQSMLKVLGDADVSEDDKVNPQEIHQTQAVIYNAIGLTYNHLNQYPAALETYNQSLRAYEKLQNDSPMDVQASHSREVIHNQIVILTRQAEVLNNIGGVYISLGDYNQALTYLERSLDLARLRSYQPSSKTEQGHEGIFDNEAIFDRLSADDRDAISIAQAVALERLGSVYYHLENLPEALECGLQSAELYRQAESQRGQADAFGIVGDIYVAMNNEASALVSYSASMRLAEEIDSRSAVTSALQKIAEIYRRQGKFVAAVEQLDRACHLAEEMKAYEPLYESHRSLSVVYRQMGDFEKALQHFEQFFAIREEVRGLEVNDRLKNLEISYQVENSQKEAEIYQLRSVTLQAEIREREQLEQLLLFANQQLQQEVTERERLIADLDAFSQMVAHDLKTPLTNISLSAGVLRSTIQQNLHKHGEGATSVFKVQREYLERILEMISKSDRIISELLMLASVRKEKVQLQPLDMDQILQDVLSRLSNLIDEFQVKIELADFWPTALGHAPWIEEVWANYISNAIHYGGRPPHLEVGADDLGDKVRFWVKDNGSGISEADQANLFIEFGRLATTRLSGHGLGLSIVKRIVEKLNGSVGVVSEGKSGQGALFFFTLPKAM